MEVARPSFQHCRAWVRAGSQALQKEKEGTRESLVWTLVVHTEAYRPPSRAPASECMTSHPMTGERLQSIFVSKEGGTFHRTFSLVPLSGWTT